MRWLLLVPFALLLPSAAAQEVESGCVESNPCEFIVDVDENGFTLDQELNGTSGDWFVLNAFNFDEVEHTITLAGHASVTVDWFTDARSAPFQLGAAGDYELRDDPSGTTQIVQVHASQSVESSGTTPGEERATPGVPMAVFAAAMLLLAARQRST